MPFLLKISSKYMNRTIPFTSFSKAAREAVTKGELVSNEIVTDLIIQATKENDSDWRGYLLDGYPRSLGHFTFLHFVIPILANSIFLP